MRSATFIDQPPFSLTVTTPDPNKTDESTQTRAVHHLVRRLILFRQSNHQIDSVYGAESNLIEQQWDEDVERKYEANPNYRKTKFAFLKWLTNQDEENKRRVLELGCPPLNFVECTNEKIKDFSVLADEICSALFYQICVEESRIKMFVF